MDSSFDSFLREPGEGSASVMVYQASVSDSLSSSNGPELRLGHSGGRRNRQAGVGFYHTLVKGLIEIERTRGRTLVRVLLGAAQGLAELLLEDAVAVLERGDLALEDVLGAVLVVVDPRQQGVEVLAACERLLGLAMGEDRARGGVDHQIGATVGAADGQLAGLSMASL